METQPKHIGRQIRRMRELRGIKQETLAEAVGMSQQSVSILENSELVDDGKLAEIAKALGVSAEAIKNFSEEAVINFFNSFYDNSSAQSVGGSMHTNHMHCTFNPIDKIMELYERLLAEKERNK